MRISDWSSDVCSSDLLFERAAPLGPIVEQRFVAIAECGEITLAGQPRFGFGIGMRIALEPAFVDHRRYHLDRPPPVIVGDGIDALAIAQLVAFRLVAGEAERKQAADRAIEVNVESGRAECRERGGNYVL